MKKLVCLLFALSVGLGAACAMALTAPPGAKATVRIGKDKRSSKKIREEFVDFGEWVLNGEIWRPSATWFSSQKRPDFERLLRLKRSFLPELMRSGMEVRQSR